MYDIAASIVIYRNNKDVLRRAIDSFLQTDLKCRLFVIDNSPTDDLRNVCSGEKVEYIFNDKNLGFGVAHNIALRKMLGQSKYFLVLNPDVYFEIGVLKKIFSFMEKSLDVGLLMPKVLYPDSSVQYLCRLLPNPFDLLLRKSCDRGPNILINFLSKYELGFADHTKMMDVPYLSGCFMFLRTEVLSRSGVFDERFFLYFEDLDLSRRIRKLCRTVYYPNAVVYHNYERGSNKDIVFLKHLISSGVKYFNKWGWFFDKERKMVNRETLKNIPRVPNN